MSARKLAVSAIALIVAGALHAAPQADAAHDHAAHGKAAPAGKSAAAPAAGWATDAPLREGMGRVRAALSDLAHHEMGHMSNDQARGFAVEIEDAVQFMFANCKLDAAPDAALHQILVPLLSSAQRLSKDPNDKPAIEAMRKAVAPYAKQFDDPQWKDDGKAAPAKQEHAH